MKYRNNSVIIDGVAYKELDLPKIEYAKVHSAFVRHIADAPSGTKIIIKPHGEYIYTAIIEDYLPRFIDKDYY